MISKIKRMVKSIRDNLRKNIIYKSKRKELLNKEPSIISCDCLGGLVSHDLGLQFRSPTINMYMTASDYIKFIYNIKTYIDINMLKDDEKSYKEGYPVAKLGDIYLYLVHYKSVEEAQIKWNDRKKRINWDNIFFIMNDRNGCTYKEKQLFSDFILSNNYKGIFFTSDKLENMNIPCVYVNDKDKKGYIPDLTRYTGLLHRGYDIYNWTQFLNSSYNL